VALGAWRHLRRRFPLRYEHGYWAAVFPLGMYTVCTQRLIEGLGLPFLAPLAQAFVWVALAAWALTFAGLVRHVGFPGGGAPAGEEPVPPGTTAAGVGSPPGGAPVER
jgi:hypothetical protein